MRNHFSSLLWAASDANGKWSYKKFLKLNQMTFFRLLCLPQVTLIWPRLPLHTYTQTPYDIQRGCAFYWFGIMAIKFLLLPIFFFALHHHFLICELNCQMIQAKVIHHDSSSSSVLSICVNFFFFSLFFALLERNKSSTCELYVWVVTDYHMELQMNVKILQLYWEVSDEIVKNIVSDINASCGKFILSTLS